MASSSHSYEKADIAADIALCEKQLEEIKKEIEARKEKHFEMMSVCLEEIESVQQEIELVQEQKNENEKKIMKHEKKIIEHEKKIMEIQELNDQLTSMQNQASVSCSAQNSRMVHGMYSKLATICHLYFCRRWT